jgi:hypothetical protein
MKSNLSMIALFAACLPAAAALGHGHPIHVEVATGALVVSGGMPDSFGFADQIFVEQDADGDPVGNQTFSGFGPATYWNVPGFDIFGMAENSGLYLDVLVRPVANSNPAIQRVLWYWDPTSGGIEQAPLDNHFQIRKSASVNRILAGDQTTDPTPLKFAAPLAADMGFHNHGLLLYLIHRAVTPPPGAYGFFARLTSDQYAPSDPFLILINNGFLSGPQMIDAALAINAMAVEPLIGDYNANGTVDAADYTVYRNLLGTTETMPNDETPGWVMEEDYDAWKINFGLSNGGGSWAADSAAELATAVAVPEPGSFSLTASLILAILLLTSRKIVRIVPGLSPARP